MINQKKKQEWFDQGAPLSMESEIVEPEVRIAITKGKSHKGKSRVLLIAAYNEIRERCGQQPKRIDCSSCSTALNRQMRIWLSRYDSRTEEQKEIAKKVINGTYDSSVKDVLKGETESGKLMTLEQRKNHLDSLTYFELIDYAEQQLGKRFNELKEANGNRRNIPKKILIKELL